MYVCLSSGPPSPAPALARGELHLGRERAGPAHERAGPRPGEPAGDPPAAGAGAHDGVLFFFLALAAAVAHARAGERGPEPPPFSQLQHCTD